MKKSKVEKKILFVYYTFSSFVKNDLELLKKHFNVKTVRWCGKKNIFKIMYSTMKADITFSWFAGDHAAVTVFFSRLFRKKSVIVVGGGDVADVPELNYGQFTQKRYKKRLAKYALKNADIVLPVSNFTKNEMLKRVKPKKFKLVYNGVDIDKYKPECKKENNLVITVGGVVWSNLKRKGIETFVRSAKYVPGARFVVIGKIGDDSINYLKSIASKNVKFTGYITEENLISYLQKAKVYVQPSLHEGFGVSVAEAMLCECIPVTSKCGALPEVVGDTGFFVPYGDEKATADAIKKALKSPSELGKKARQEIINNFTINIREKQFLKILKELE